MTRERLEELNEAWNELDSIVPVISLLQNVEDGSVIHTHKNSAKIPTELVKRFTNVAWEYYRELDKKFKEM